MIPYYRRSPEEVLKEKMLREQLGCPVCSQWVSWCKITETPHEDWKEDGLKAFWQNNKEHIMAHENEMAEKYKGNPFAGVDWFRLSQISDPLPYLCSQCLHPDQKGVCTCGNSRTQKKGKE